MQKVRLTNMTKAVLVLPDVNNWNHRNILPNSYIELTPVEYHFYKLQAEKRIANKQLKHELVSVEVKAEKVLPKQLDNSVEDEFKELDSTEELAGLDEDDSSSKAELKKKKKIKK